ncbi:alpha-N-acetylglucosaminidase TIM-barrel domain-containing protein [Kitasatospora terrestris]|uniref:Alpha-N-acetylglucosaminidase n=1 Tax=Kitasatospora terrestris TaxID=258051 RepID=A0ABP9DG21_9ACTN
MAVTTVLSAAAATVGAAAAAAVPTAAAASSAFDTSGVQQLAARLIGPGPAAQITFVGQPRTGSETFTIKGTAGAVEIDGTTPAALSTGFGWYLKYVTHSDIAWDSSRLSLPATMPAPAGAITQSANVGNRLYGNDIWTDYTGPHWTFADWSREIDILAIQGYNQIFMPVGVEDIAHRTMQQYGYSRSEMLAWTSPPSHMAAGMWQGGWTLADGGISETAQTARVTLGKQVAARMRSLGITPVMPGFVGFVPDDFGTRNAGAKVVSRGTWFSQSLLSWLDPSTTVYQQVAKTFYSLQDATFGATSMYAMNPFTEGGNTSVDLAAAGQGIQRALQTAHPGAIWEMHAWSGNPSGSLISALNKATTLVVDFNSDRSNEAAGTRESQWGGMPYSFGGVLDFGGHTTMGDNLGVWNSRYWAWKNRTGSALAGIGVSPEAGHGDALVPEFIGEMAWRTGPVTIDDWFTQYALRRYGAADGNATAAWLALAHTAYATPADGWDEEADSLFNARPSLNVNTAASWSPTTVRYDTATFESALTSLLAVSPALQNSSAYKYDLAVVARQVLDNNSRVLLPQIKSAHTAKDLTRLRSLTSEWLNEMKLTDQLVGTVQGFLLGPWIAQASADGADAAESAKFVADAKEVLTTWGNQALSEAGLHDYCNRDWNGLVGDLYYDRWNTYFNTLITALQNNTTPTQTDWYSKERDWINTTGTSYATTASTADVHALAVQAQSAYTKVNGSNTTTTVVSAASGKCLDDAAFNTADGAKVDIWTCDGGANQQWTYDPTAKTLTTMGKCLDDFAFGRTPGSKVDLWTCDGGANQQWTFNSNGTVTGLAGLCLEVAKAATVNGTPVQLNTCNGNSNQAWSRV